MKPATKYQTSRQNVMQLARLRRLATSSRKCFVSFRHVLAEESLPESQASAPWDLVAVGEQLGHGGSKCPPKLLAASKGFSGNVDPRSDVRVGDYLAFGCFDARRGEDLRAAHRAFCAAMILFLAATLNGRRAGWAGAALTRFSPGARPTFVQARFGGLVLGLGTGAGRGRCIWNRP